MFNNVSWGALIMVVCFLHSKIYNFFKISFFLPWFYPLIWTLCFKGRVSVRLQCKHPLLWLADIFSFEIAQKYFSLSFSVFLLLQLSRWTNRERCCITFRSMALYLDGGMKGWRDEHCVVNHRHVVELIKAVISSLQLNFCTLTNAFIFTNSANVI